MPQRNASANLPRLVDLNKFRPQLSEPELTSASIELATLESQVGYQGEDGYFEITPAPHETTQTSLDKSPAPDTQVGKQVTTTISLDLKSALRPRPAESESTTSAPIEAATFNPPFENQEIDDKNFEIRKISNYLKFIYGYQILVAIFYFFSI